MLMTNIPDPIFEVANPKLYEGRYFWDETWSDHHGPYNTEDIAREHLNEYCKELNII